MKASKLAIVALLLLAPAANAADVKCPASHPYKRMVLPEGVTPECEFKWCTRLICSSSPGMVERQESMGGASCSYQKYNCGHCDSSQLQTMCLTKKELEDAEQNN